jgi:putative hydrolase of the HAD superfamily
MNRPKPLTHPIKAVTFDVGGTLVVPHPSVGEVYCRIASQHGVRGLSPEMLEKRFRQAWDAARGFPQRREEWEALVDEVFTGLADPLPSQTFFGELYDEFRRARAWKVLPEVIPTLEALAALGVDLGVVSNWDERLRPLLAELRLDRYFTCFAISCEAGFAKPSPVIFQEALRQLGQPRRLGPPCRRRPPGGFRRSHERGPGRPPPAPRRTLERPANPVARGGGGLGDPVGYGTSRRQEPKISYAGWLTDGPALHKNLENIHTGSRTGTNDPGVKVLGLRPPAAGGTRHKARHETAAAPLPVLHRQERSSWAPLGRYCSSS